MGAAGSYYFVCSSVVVDEVSVDVEASVVDVASVVVEASEVDDACSCYGYSCSVVVAYSVVAAYSVEDYSDVSVSC